MTPLGWRRCLRLTRPAQSQAYKIIKKFGEFNNEKFFIFDFGEIEVKGHRYKIIKTVKKEEDDDIYGTVVSNETLKHNLQW